MPCHGDVGSTWCGIRSLNTQHLQLHSVRFKESVIPFNLQIFLSHCLWHEYRSIFNWPDGLCTVYSMGNQTRSIDEQFTNWPFLIRIGQTGGHLHQDIPQTSVLWITEYVAPTCHSSKPPWCAEWWQILDWWQVTSRITFLALILIYQIQDQKLHWGTSCFEEVSSICVWFSSIRALTSKKYIGMLEAEWIP